MTTNEKSANEASGKNSDDELLSKLEVIGNGGWFLWKVFFLCMVPSILNGLHLTSYVYLAEVPLHWCEIPELSSSNWTDEQIRRISSPSGSNQSSCQYYNWNYSMFLDMDFPDALAFAETQRKPELMPCSSFQYADGFSSMVINYNLVCDRTALKSMIQVSLSLGKFLGAFFFGILSDKYGRKTSFLIGCILYVVSGPTVAFAVNYSMLAAGRIGLGAACSAIYHSAYIILSEIASKKRRAALGILYNMSYPMGQMIVPVVAYFFRDWKTLQLIISVPAFPILIFYWFIPESPRWLLLKNRKDEAAQIILRANESQCKGRWVKQMEDCEIQAMTERAKGAVVSVKDDGKRSDTEDNVVGFVNVNETGNGILEKLLSTLKQFIELMKYFELRSRLFIILASWCTCSLSYYALALNVDNFLSDRYIYGFLTGLVEVPSYILPLPLLRYFGRRHTSILLFYIGGFALLTILAIPRESDLAILLVASIGRLCASAVFAVVILHTTELFPTLLRNTAMGCCSTAAHIGSMSAPLVVDMLGKYAWFIPSTVCGVVTFLAGTMIFLLPETKNKPLPDTVEDVVGASKENKIGFHQICRI